MNRSDKKRNIDKVASTLVKNPLATESELAEATGLGMGTVHRAKKEVERSGEFKDDRIISLTDGDFEIMQEIQRIKRDRLKEPDKIDNREIDLWENTANKRYTLFKGDITNPDGGLKSIRDMMFDDDIE